MLLHLLYPLADQFPVFNVFRYLTFRTGGAVMTALIVGFVLGPSLIRALASRQSGGQPIRDDGPESHILTKRGTPTMGGFLILIATFFATLLWADLANTFVWAVLAVTLGYGAIGFVDDYLKVAKRNVKGLPGKMKLLVQILVAAAAAWPIAMPQGLGTHLAVPFAKGFLIDFGPFFIFFAAFVMVGSSNAVNLTDGLDGLAIVPVMIAAGCFALIAYLVGNAVFSNYLRSLGFLWFNAPPARVFMGDTGSLALGGSLGATAVATKHELVLAIIGGLFVLETVSVIVQVASFKLTGKRIFAMAPLHHHFEKKGWAESTIVIRFWIIATILALIGLSTLKLR